MTCVCFLPQFTGGDYQRVLENENRRNRHTELVDRLSTAIAAPACRYVSALIANTIPKPTNAEIIFITVHVFSVCPTVNPKY